MARKLIVIKRANRGNRIGDDPVVFMNADIFNNRAIHRLHEPFGIGAVLHSGGIDH